MSKRGHLIRMALYLLLTLCVFNTRPAIIGQKFGELYFLFTIAVFIILLISTKRLVVKKEVLFLYLFYLLFYTYVVFQYYFLQKENFTLVFSSFLLISLGMFGFITYKEGVFQKMVRTVSIIYSVFAVSYVITLLMVFFDSDIQIGEIKLMMRDDYDYIYPVYFPISIAYNGSVRILSETLPRAIANFREPGLLQLILIYLFWVNFYLKLKNYKLMNVCLLVLLLLTFSTAGYIAFAISVIIYLITKDRFSVRKYIYAFLVIAAFSSLMLYADTQFSIENKFSNQSGLIRLNAALVSFDLLKEHPLLGIGFDQKYKDIPIGVNFLGTMAQVGIFGTIFLLLPFFYTIKVILKRNKKYLTLVAPLLLTLLFSQPLYDKAITVYFLATSIYLALYEHQLLPKPEISPNT